jgi:CubicO group peptidase (beta-lactamase class C family)
VHAFEPVILYESDDAHAGRGEARIVAVPGGPAARELGVITRELPARASVDEALAYFGTYLEFQQRFQRVPGIQAAAGVDGELVFSIACGFADVERRVPLAVGHLYRIASHSKTFTSTIVMRLVEEGALRLDDPAERWVEQLAGSAIGRITVRQLLANAGGLFRDGSDGDFWQLFRPFPDRDALVDALLEDGAAVLPPNEHFKYSNMGFALLGLIAESAGGATYAELARAKIVEPLGLRNTGPDLDGTRLDDYVTGYTSHEWGDHRVPVENVGTWAFAPATGFYSTAGDLVAFFTAHCLGDERLLSDTSKREMQHPLWEMDGKGTLYGLGMVVVRVNGRELVGHSGGWPGQVTRSIVDSRTGLVLTVLTNATGGPAEALAIAGVKLVDLAGSRPRLDSSDGLERFSGRFVHSAGLVDIAVLGGRLYALTPALADPATDAIPLDLVDGQTLRFAGGSGAASYWEPVRFTFRDNGTIASVRGGSGKTMTPIQDFVMPERVVLHRA